MKQTKWNKISKGLGVALVGYAAFMGSVSADTSKPVRLTVSNVLSDTHPTSVGLHNFAKEVEEKTNGSVKVNVITGGALGSEDDTINQLVTGALNMALIQGVSIFQGLDGRLSIEDVPFLFESRAHAYESVDGAFGDRVSEILGEKGVKVLAYWENGFRHFTNSKRPITVPEDMEGIKFRSTPSTIRLAMFKELGANAVPMAFTELFTGLQQKTVDGQENPLPTIYTSKFYEVQDYLTLSGHIWNAAVLVVNPNVWEKMDSEQQAIVQEAAFKHRDQVRKNITEQDAKIVEELKENGMEVNDVNAAVFRDAVKNVTAIYSEQHGDELLKLINN